MTAASSDFGDIDAPDDLQARVGDDHASRRLELEQAHDGHVHRWQHRLFHFESWYSLHGWIRHGLRMTGLYRRSVENARRPALREHHFHFPALPLAFDGFRILQLSDLHLDMDLPTTRAIIEAVSGLDYDICVLTGDYRARTFGNCDAAMALMGELRDKLADPVYAVLGNHDSIHMLPAMEALGIRVLMNEGDSLNRDGASIGLAGIDDAHYFHLHDIERAFAAVKNEPVKILLSHTPEVYDEAAAAGFDAFLCGHTHGGQLCLPGGIPLKLESRCPRFLGKGAWRQGRMQGYTSTGASTSMVNVRLNCPGEITMHHLHSSPALKGEAQ